MAERGRRNSSGGSRGGTHREDGGRHMRYSTEQLVVFKRIYAECSKPSLSRRKQMIREYPVLANVDAKQIKIWFQNRRCRDKVIKEASQLQSENKELIAKNNLLIEENNRLQKQVALLISENETMRIQLQNVTGANIGKNCETTAGSSQHSSRTADYTTGLLLVAEETRIEFLSKATGNAVDWVPIPGMKPGVDSVGGVSVARNCVGVAARACSLVYLEPIKIPEILKDRLSWFQDCRKLEVFANFPAENGAIIELIYSQFYAPTTLALGRDFWTLRYTSTSEDGSIVVCEKSMSGSGASPCPSAASQFTRANMLASGYLIRPCGGGGSIVHIVDHLDLEALCIPEVLRPLYESSKLVAQKMTIAAMLHMEQIARETSSRVTPALGKQPAVLRSFKQRLSRSFNDAINGFIDDGWSLMSRDTDEDLIISVNSTKNVCTVSNPSSALSLSGGILCLKASMILQDVSPALLVRFLRERRSEWADFNIDARSAASLKAGSLALQGSHSTQFSASTTVLRDTANDEEILEIIRLEAQAISQKDAFLFRDIYFLQVCNGVEENAIGACSELIFAPIDDTLPDDALMLSSGFRILTLDSKTVEVPVLDTRLADMGMDKCPTLVVGQPPRSMLATLKMQMASIHEAYTSTDHIAGDHSSSNDLSSVFVIAFQFPFESHLQENVATMARKYIRNVISSVQRLAKSVQKQPVLSPLAGVSSPQDPPDAATLANWICRSYSTTLGTDLLMSNYQSGGSVLEQLWHHQNAILCYSFKSLPICLFANQSGLAMLETSPMALKDVIMDQIFDDCGGGALYSFVPTIMQQGFVILSGGTCKSVTGHSIFYEQGVAWKVFDERGNLYCLAFALMNWSFM